MRAKRNAVIDLEKTTPKGKAVRTSRSKPAQKKLFLKGRIVDLKTKKGLTGLQIEAWDKGHVLNEALDRVSTAARGTFRLAVPADFFFQSAPKIFSSRSHRQSAQ